MSQTARQKLRRLLVPSFLLASLSTTLLLNSCSSATTAASTTNTSTISGTANAYTDVYKTLSWGTGVTVSYPSTCTMTLISTGAPAYHDAYYLGPVSTQYPTQVASTSSGLKLAVVPYTASAVVPYTATVNICPAKAAATTSTNLGPIGYITSGEYLYNAYETTLTPALGDNVSYTFIVGTISYTASFIDKCNSHPTPLTSGYTWHYHGVPLCVTAAADAASGPSHIIGIALDGFPVYGSRDISGNLITTAQLDACNGITSPTPEFPTGAYHYVLPEGVTTSRSSLTCYAGTVSKTLMAQMENFACTMRNAYTVDKKKEHDYKTRMKMGMGM
jgi:hypothetical protein